MADADAAARAVSDLAGDDTRRLATARASGAAAIHGAVLRGRAQGSEVDADGRSGVVSHAARARTRRAGRLRRDDGIASADCLRYCPEDGTRLGLVARARVPGVRECDHHADG